MNISIENLSNVICLLDTQCKRKCIPNVAKLKKSDTVHGYAGEEKKNGGKKREYFSVAHEPPQQIQTECNGKQARRTKIFR